MIPEILRRCLSAAAPAAAVAAVILVPLTTIPSAGCRSNSQTTSPKAPCDQVNVVLSPSVGVTIRGCSVSSSTLTNIAYNSDNTVRSFDFDIRCSATSEHYTGHVDITYQAGSVTGYTKRVNGQTCG